MAETDWLGMLGGLAGTAAGAYFGGPIGAQAGGALGRGLGSGISQESGLTQGEGFSDIGGLAAGSMGGGGGGMGGFDMGSIMGMFGGGGGMGGGGGVPMYRAPTMSTADLFSQAGGMLPGLAGYEVDYNRALLPLAGIQSQYQDIITPGSSALRAQALAQRQANLDLGYRLPPDLIDLVNTTFLQGRPIGSKGPSPLDVMYGRRSLAGAGLDRGEFNLAQAERASAFQPYFNPRQPFGDATGMTIMGDIRGREALENNLLNLNVAAQAGAQQKASADNANAFSSILGQAGQYMKGAGGKNVPLSKDYTGTLGSGNKPWTFGQGADPNNPNSMAMSLNQGSLNNSTMGSDVWNQPFQF